MGAALSHISFVSSYGILSSLGLPDYRNLHRDVKEYRIMAQPTDYSLPFTENRFSYM